MPKEDHEFNVRLLDAIKRRPCLYNNTLYAYGQRSVVYAAWTEVASELNSGLDHCRDIWRNIRTVLARHLKSLQSDPARVNRYYLEEELQFVVPYMKINLKQTPKPPQNVGINQQPSNDSTAFSNDSTYTYSNNVTPIVKIEPCDDADAEIINDTEDNLNDMDKFSEDRWQIDDERDQEIVTNISSSTHAVERNKRKHDQMNNSDNMGNVPSEMHMERCSRRMMHSAAANFAQVKTDPYQIVTKCTANENYSPKKMFLLSLLPDVEQMDSSQMRKFRIEVATLIDNILGDSKE